MNQVCELAVCNAALPYDKIVVYRGPQAAMPVPIVLSSLESTCQQCSCGIGRWEKLHCEKAAEPVGITCRVSTSVVGRSCAEKVDRKAF